MKSFEAIRKYVQEHLALRAQSIKRVAESKDGQVLMVWLRGPVCRIHQSTLSASAIEMAWHEGRRSVWLAIEAELGKNEKDIIAQAEQIERQNRQLRSDYEERGMGMGDYNGG